MKTKSPRYYLVGATFHIFLVFVIFVYQYIFVLYWQGLRGIEYPIAIVTRDPLHSFCLLAFTPFFVFIFWILTPLIKSRFENSKKEKVFPYILLCLSILFYLDFLYIKSIAIPATISCANCLDAHFRETPFSRIMEEWRYTPYKALMIGFCTFAFSTWLIDSTYWKIKSVGLNKYKTLARVVIFYGLFIGSIFFVLYACKQIEITYRICQLHDPKLAKLVDNNSDTPLHKAAREGIKPIVEFLIKQGVEIDCKNYWGTTPLQMACKKGHKDIVLLLIDNGACITWEDQNGYAALHYTVQEKGHLEIAKILLDRGAPLWSFSKYNFTPLHIACSDGWERDAVALLFIERGADVNVRDYLGQTPLHGTFSKKVASALIEQGVDINAVDNEGHTALDWAIFYQEYCGQDFIDFLISQGAKRN